jgi:hypothetical protein
MGEHHMAVKVNSKIERPAEGEYAPYYGGYIGRVPDAERVNLFDVYAQQITTLRDLLGKLTPEQANFRFGPGEWSIKECLGHINDGERVFSYRALRISRNDQTPIAGFEQDDYVRESNFADRTLGDLLDEFELLRKANMIAFNGLPEAVYMRCGTASNNPVSVRALLYILAGHVEHHIESYKQDYLAKL